MTWNTPVLIGPLPPPVHGSSVVTQDLFEIVGRHGPSEVVDSAASRHLTSIGKLHAKVSYGVSESSLQSHASSGFDGGPSTWHRAR